MTLVAMLLALAPFTFTLNGALYECEPVGQNYRCTNTVTGEAWYCTPTNNDDWICL